MNRNSRGQIPAHTQPSNSRDKKPDTADIFFSQTNYARILQPLREQYERRLNKPELPDEVDRRLQKAVTHYMNEVYRVNSNHMPISSLNQEVYRETALNIDSWLNKQVSTPVQKSQSQSQSQFMNRDPLFDNVGSRFEREQQTRSVTQIPQATPIDFSITNDDDENAEDPIEKYERLRKQREAEVRLTNNIKTKNTIETNTFSEPSAAAPTNNLPPIQQNSSNLPLATLRPQDYIIKQEDVIKYKENEINLYIYSGDRDWLNNKNENRYNFTINFNTINDNGNTMSPSVKERFKNITRMELVKAIVSAESLEVSVLVNNLETNTNRITNVLSYPYLMIRLSEWTGNGFGTNQYIDDTFGLVQYDQAWKSDLSAPNFGYLSMTPRYLKAQRVYQPTPLATLQKLSIQVERPDGKPLTRELDTLDVNKIYLAKSIIVSVYSNVPNDESYIFINTATYFSKFFIAEGDRIVFRGFTLDTDVYVTKPMADDFNGFINRPSGHIVCGIGYTSDTTMPVSVYDGANAVGYANYIIIRSRFADPTTGSTARNYFGGGADSTNEAHIKDKLDNSTTTTQCALLNTNRQSHFVLRLITRDMDATSNLRPDNS
jgi:hypothetical protein